MTPQSILLGLGAGLISAIVFVSATTGPMLSRVILFLLTPFAIYLAGLGLGFLPALAAGLTASLAVTLLGTPQAGLVFAASEAVPAVMLTRHSLLSRGEDTDREWYPPGRLVANAALFGSVFAMLALVMIGGDVEALTKAVREVVEKFAKTELINLPGAPALTGEQISGIVDFTVKMLPPVLAISVMGSALLNLWLAAHVTKASGRLERPWPDIAGFELPSGSALALVAALALSFVGGVMGLIGGGFAGAMLFAFALLGLAVAHTLTRDSPWRNFTLSALYAALFLFGGMFVLLVILGLAETLFSYRRTQTPGGPPSQST